MTRFKRTLLTCGLCLMAAAAGAHDVVTVGEECPAREYHVLSVPGPDHHRFRAFLLFSKEDKRVEYPHGIHLHYVTPTGIGTGIDIDLVSSRESVRWSSAMLPKTLVEGQGHTHRWWRILVNATHPVTVHGYIIDNQGGIANLTVKEIEPPQGPVTARDSCYGHRVWQPPATSD